MLQLIGSILVVTLLPLAVVFGLLIWWLRRKKVAVTRQWEQEGVIFRRGPEAANFSGLESKGPAQVRGNGFIALTEQDLRVTRVLPPAEWHIPFPQIKTVTLEPSFLGKRRTSQVLVISFESDGQPDRLGVYVSDGPAWVEAISNAAGLRPQARRS